MTTPQGAVVIGYDGSRDSRLALAWAKEAARGRRRPLLVLIAEDELAQVVARSGDAARATNLVADAYEHLRASGSDDISVEKAGGPPATALLRAAAEASLLVLGAEGHGRLSGLAVGSVSQHVCGHATCPVVVVRRPEDPRADTVTVGVDPSRGSDHALAFGFEQASRTGAPLEAVFALSAFPPVSGSIVSAPLDSLADQPLNHERALSEALAGWTEGYPDVLVRQRCVDRQPVPALTEASRRASMVVVGSRGRGPVTGLFLGSVSQGVLHKARCPVVVAR